MYSGPLSPNRLDILPQLTEKQFLDEISYLRLTVAPGIRKMRRVKGVDGKFKMEKFSVMELQASIGNALKPEDNVTEDIDILLMNTLKS